MVTRQTDQSPPDLARGKRIEAARKARGFTQASTAQAMGVSRVAVTNWEAGLMPEAWRWPRLARVLGAGLDWLILGVGDPRRIDIATADAGDLRSAPKPDTPEAYVAKLRAHLDQMRRLAGRGAKLTIVDPAARALLDPEGRPLARIVPFVGRVAAGPWLDAEPPYPFDATDDDPIISTRALGERVFALEVVGDSMARAYRHGDRVVIDPDRVPRPRADDVIVKLTDSNDPDYRVTLKRLVKIELDAKNHPRRLLLEGRPESGEPDRLDLAARRAQIVGTVVEHLPRAA
jgi:SOS-response transcriptional repressor LexA